MRGKAWQVLFAPSLYAIHLKKPGFELRWMTWRATSVRSLGPKP